MNTMLALLLQVTIEEIGHRHPVTELITHNSAAKGNLNGKIKQN